MELITSQIDRIEDLLARLDETVDSARSMPFSTKVNVEKEALFGVIDEIRAIVYEMRKGLPSEINQARRVLHDKDSHISEARTRAEMIIKAAETQANEMTSAHEITQQAKQAAAEIMEETNKEVSDFKLSAAQYVDGIFGDLDDTLRATLESQMQKTKEVEDFYRNILEELYVSRKSIRVEAE
jgi:DNA anti-recombination protein RmuC